MAEYKRSELLKQEDLEKRSKKKPGIGRGRTRGEKKIQFGDPKTIYRPRPSIKPPQMLTGGQAKLDKNKNNKIDAQDFKMLRAEKSKPGKVMKAKMGKAVEYKKYLKGLKNAVNEVKKEKMERKGKEFIKRRKALGLSKGGDVKKTKKLKDDYFKVLGVFPTVKKKMGGGMMNKPMGYKSGGKAKSKPASPKRKDEGLRDDTFDPIMKKPEGMKKELAMIQTEDAISRKNIGDGKKMTRRGLMKVVDAAADDRQLGRSLRKFQRDVFKTGGSVMARGCKLGRKKKTKLY